MHDCNGFLKYTAIYYYIDNENSHYNNNFINTSFNLNYRTALVFSTSPPSHHRVLTPETLQHIHFTFKIIERTQLKSECATTLCYQPCLTLNTPNKVPLQLLDLVLHSIFFYITNFIVLFYGTLFWLMF